MINNTPGKESAYSEDPALTEPLAYDTSRLTICDRFVFRRVMSDPVNTLPLLQMLFPELCIEKLENIDSEKDVEHTIDAKAVRFDVFVKDIRGRAFTIEMQVQNTGSLPLRARYYASSGDMEMLRPGQNYNELEETVVIFICPFDPFGRGAHRYSFCSICEEYPDLKLGDRRRTIFLNSKGTADDVSTELRAFLNYINGVISDTNYVRQLDEAVMLARQDAKWVNEYMRWDMELKNSEYIGRQQGYAEGIRQGIQQGVQQGIQQESLNTERERRRADAAEIENRRLREQIAALLKEREHGQE